MDTPGIEGAFKLLLDKQYFNGEEINGRKIRIKFTPEQSELLMMGDTFFGEKGYKFWKLNNVWFKPIPDGTDFSWEAVNEVDLVQYALNNWSKING